jgi:hypothetical protein
MDTEGARPMSDDRQRQQALAAVDTSRQWAARLLAAANHPTMKHEIGLAIEHLDETVRLLNHKDEQHGDATYAIIDMTLEEASARLTAVEQALEKYGPDAMLIG